MEVKAIHIDYPDIHYICFESITYALCVHHKGYVAPTLLIHPDTKHEEEIFPDDNHPVWEFVGKIMDRY